MPDNGFALYDVSTLEDAGGPFEAVIWDSTDDLLSIFKKHYDRVVRMEQDGRWLWFLLQGPRRDSDNPSDES